VQEDALEELQYNVEVLRSTLVVLGNTLEVLRNKVGVQENTLEELRHNVELLRNTLEVLENCNNTEQAIKVVQEPKPTNYKPETRLDRWIKKRIK
jgi:uncharacterized coiled-coil protein SlyX